MGKKKSSKGSSGPSADIGNVSTLGVSASRGAITLPPSGSASFAVELTDSVRGLLSGTNDRGKSFNERLARLRDGLGITLERFNGAHFVSFVIRGPPGKLAEARRRLAGMFHREVSVAVRVPQAHHAFIAGRKGRTIQRICADTLTRIVLPQDGAAGDAAETVRITGTPEACAAAEAAIREISEECLRNTVEAVDVDKAYHAAIAGRGQEFAVEVQRDTGAAVTFPPIHGTSGKVYIKGSPDQIKRARDRLLARLAAVKAASTKVEVEIPARAERYVRGPRHRTLQEICDETSAHVLLGQAKGDKIPVTITGAPEDTQRAFNLIMEKASNTYEEVEVRRDLHRFVMGAKGATIVAIGNDTLTHIRAPPYDSDIDYFTIEGKAAAVRAARKRVEEVVASVKDVEVAVPPEYRSYIIGPKGERVQNLRKKFFVSCRIPEPEDVDAPVVVSGIPGSGLELAVYKIGELVAERDAMPVRIDVPGVPYEHFRFIIGAKGATLSKVMKETKTRVNVTTAEDVEKAIAKDKEGAESMKPKITVEGLRENAERARDMILELSKTRENLPVHLDVSVPAKVFRFVHGEAAGALKEEFGGEEKASVVSVNWPPLFKIPADAEDVNVVVKGPKDDAARAVAAVRALAAKAKFEVAKIDPDAYPYLIGPKGSRIQKVRQDNNVIINFPARAGGDSSSSSSSKKKGGDATVAVDEAIAAKAGGITVIGYAEGVKGAIKDLAALESEKGELPVTEEYEMSAVHRSVFLHGDKEQQQKIEVETGVSLRIPWSSSADGIKIHGAPTAIAKARKALDKVCSQIVDNEVRVPEASHAYVIGPKGSRIKELAALGDAQIIFPNSRSGPKRKGKGKGKGAEDDAEGGDEGGKNNNNNNNKDDADPDVIHVIGLRSEVERVREGILALAREHLDQPITVTCSIPQDLHRALIGPEGRTVREVQAQTSTEIHFPSSGSGKSDAGAAAAEGAEGAAKRPKKRGGAPDVIRVRGRADDCERAVAKLEKLAASVTTVEFNIPGDHVAYVVGVAGKSLMEIRQSTGVQIKISGGTKGRSRRKGKGKGKGKGKAEKKEGGEEEEEEELEEGEIREDKPAGSKDDAKDDAGGDDGDGKAEEVSQEATVKITGIKQMVDKAAKLIRRRSAEKARTSAEATVVVDPEMHGHIIGAKGARIERLQAEYGCRIQMPRSRDPDPRLITVVGTASQVTECARAIADLVERAEERKRRDAERAAAAAKAAEAKAAEPEDSNDGNKDDAANENGVTEAKESATPAAAEDDLSNPFESAPSSSRADKDQQQKKEKKEKKEKKKDIDVGSIHWPGIDGKASGSSSAAPAAAFWPRPSAKKEE